MASRFATKPQALADDMDRCIFTLAERAYDLFEKTKDRKWQNVAACFDRARSSLLDLMHPDDRRAALEAETVIHTTPREAGDE